MAEPSTSTEMVRVPILGENGRISDDYIPESIPQSVTAAEQAAESAASSANQALQQAAAAEKAASSATGSVEQAKTYANNASTYMSTAESHAESAATDAQSASDSASAAAASATAAEESNKSAAQSSADAMGFRNNAVQYRDQAREAAQEAQGYVTTVQQLEQNATNSATAAQNSATSASASAETATTAASQASTSATNAAASAQTASEKAASVLDHYIESATATTLEPGSQATATVADKVLQLGIPKGEKGDTGLGIPEGGSAGQVVKKTADGTEWAYDTGAVYNSEEGLQEMAEDGTHDPIYNFGITQGGMSASMSVMGDSPEVATDYTSGTTSYRNAIGADAKGPYVDLNLSGAAEGATKYRYIDDPSKFATSDGIPTTKAVSNAIGASIITGTSTGLVSHGEDAYAQKPIEVRIKGKTWVNRWPVISGTVNGVTVSTDDTGLITVSGTSTARAAFTNYVYSVAANKSVTVKSSSSISGVSINVQSYANGEFIANIANIGSNYGNRTEATGTVSPNATHLVCEIEISADATVNASFRVMLVDGTEAPDCFTPPASITSVKSENLVTSGKNLFAVATGTANGVTLSKNDDSTYTLSGTCTAAAFFRSSGVGGAMSKKAFPDGTYALSVSVVGGYSGMLFFRARDTSGTIIGQFNQASGTSVWTLKDISCFEITVPDVFSGNAVIRVQLELGSTATAYEPPTVTETPLPEVELRGLPNGTCDELVIKSDGTCEVDRRTGYIASYTDEEVTGEYVSTGNGLEAGASIVYELDEPTTEPQSPVTLPALPAPTFNQYHDSAVPSDTSTEYVRDINIVLANLEAKVSELSVNQASTKE